MSTELLALTGLGICLASIIGIALWVFGLAAYEMHLCEIEAAKCDELVRELQEQRRDQGQDVPERALMSQHEG